MSIYKKINNSFLEFQKKITDKIWVAFLVWLIFVALANLFIYLQIGGEITPAMLELIGIILFLESLWKGFKRRKNKSTNHTQIKTLQNNSSYKQNKAHIFLFISVGLFIIFIIFIGIYYYAYNHLNNSEIPIQKYDNKTEEQSHQVKFNIPDSVKNKKEQQLNECLAATTKWYDDMIDNYCKDYEIKENCDLPEDMVYKLIDIQREYRDECLVRYE